MNQYRMHKCLSLDGRVRDIRHVRPRGEYVTADLGPWGLPPREYVGSSPQDYDPHPGFAQFPEAEYEAYDPGMPHHPTPMLRDRGPEPVPPAEPMPGYNDCPMTEELRLRVMADAGVQLPVAGPAEADSFEDLLGSPQFPAYNEYLDVRIASLMTPDIGQEIESAIDQQMQLADAFEPPQPEPMQPDPFEEQQRMYDEQMQQLMDPFGTMGPMM